MTKQLPFTQASVRKAIRAAQHEGLRVTGIRTDGTVLVDDGEKDRDFIEPPKAKASKWEDAQQ